jgi:hypothetical protein
MVIIDNILYLSFKELTKWFSANFLKKELNHYREGAQASYANISDPSDGRKVLIAYESIPEATRQEKGMPSIDSLKKECLSSEIARQSGFSEASYNFFLQHKDIKQTKGATRAHHAKAKAEQAHILQKLATIKPTEVRALGFTDKPAYYTDAIGELKKLAEARQWPSWKCTGLAGLNKKLKPFQQAAKGNITAQQAWESLVSKRVNNDNALKIDNDQQALLVQLYANPDGETKLTVEQTFDFYTRKANEMIKFGHWDKKALITVNAIRAFLFKPGIKPLWYESRHGYQQYRNVFEPVTERINASFANALWVIDGTPIHNYFQHLDKGKYFRWNIFIVLDAASHCVLGFWLSETENTEAVIGALRSAALVSGKLPHQVQYDNSSAIQSYRSQHAIHAMSIVAFPATAGNARSKVVEGYFAWFNNHVQKFNVGFTANPFAKTLDNQPNREALALAVKNGKLPLAENAMDQLIEDFTIANNMPRPFLGNLSPLEFYRKSVASTQHRQREFTKAIDIEAFYAMPGQNKQVRTMVEGKPKMVSTFVHQEYEFTNNGIEITIGKPFTYDIEEPAFRKQFIGEKFTVRYEPNPKLWTNGQPNELLLYVQGNPLQWKGMHMAALPKRKFHMAVADYYEGERAELGQHLDRKKMQRAMVQSDFEELVESTKKSGTYTPVIKANAYDKEVLQAANAYLLNQKIQGDDFNLSQVPEPLPEGVKLDRLELGLDGPQDDDDENF